MLNEIVRYLDLNSEIRPRGATGKSKKNGAKKIQAWPQWLTLLAGIIVQPYLTTYQVTGTWSFELEKFWGWLIFSIITAIIIFPSVYKKAFDANKPLGVLLAPIFTVGIGWESVFSVAAKVTS